MTEKRGFFDNLKHQLGGTPAPDDIIKAKDDKKSDANTPKDSNPKDPAKDTPKDTPKDSKDSKDTPQPAADSAKDSKKDPAKDTKVKKPKALDDEDDRLNLDLLKSLLDAADAAATDDPDDDDDDDTSASDDDYATDDDESLSSAVFEMSTPILRHNLPDMEGPDMLDNYEDYKTLGKDIFNYDAGKGMSALLKDWFKRTLRKEKELRMEFLSGDLDEYLKDPSAVLVTKEAIKRAADNSPLPVKVLFVNKIDKNDNKEYETLDEALASVKDNPYIMAFANDPKAVFKQIWRVVNADGSLGGKVSEDAIDHFIDTFDGDKKVLRAKLGRPEQRQQNQQRAFNKPQSKDKGNNKPKSNKPSDNSSGASGAGN